MKSEIPGFLLKRYEPKPPAFTGFSSKKPFFDRGIDHFGNLIKTSFAQWETANRHGFLQGVDPRIKLLFLLFFLFVVNVKRTLLPEIFVIVVVCALALLSRLNLAAFYRKVLLLALIFGFFPALPSILNVVVSGEVLLPIAHLPKEYDFWVYHIPETIGITRQGIEGVTMLTIRVINSLSLTFLVIHTTPFTEITRALKSLKVPDQLLVTITLAYKYIFLFARIIEEVHLARKSRVVGLDMEGTREWVAGRVAFLFRKTQIRCGEIFDAMQAKGFSGDIILYSERNMAGKDFLTGMVLFLVGIIPLTL